MWCVCARVCICVPYFEPSPLHFTFGATPLTQALAGNLGDGDEDKQQELCFKTFTVRQRLLATIINYLSPAVISRGCIAWQVLPILYVAFPYDL